MAPRSPFRLRFDEHQQSPERKAAFTNALFDDVAPVYDRFHLGMMSFFRDIHWKRWLVKSIAADLPQGPIVDLATGTGSIALLLAKQFPQRQIVGTDINAAMLERARSANRFAHLRFEQGNLYDLAFPAGSVACFTGGYALRNSPDLPRLIASMAEQLAPGGEAVFLDFSRPAHRVGSALTLALLRLWTGLWSVLLHQNLQVLGYIPQSLAAFPDRVALQALFEAGGFTCAQRRRFLFGVMECSRYTLNRK